MHKILQLDGGGAKGVMTSIVLAEIEKTLGKPICETFDMIVGTSVGSILGGVLAKGNIEASLLNSLMYKSLDEVFKKRFLRTIRFIGNGKYDRSPLVDILNRYIGSDVSMSECKTKFLCTSVSVNDGRNHYFKSWENKDGKELLVDVINRSYAAPYYFDPIHDYINRTTWLDGGTGNSNCSLDEAIIELYNLGWINQKCHILSVGTGYHDTSISFDESRRWKNIKSVMFFANPMEGGLARLQSTKTKVKMAKEIAKYNDNFSFQRIDTVIPKDMDGLDLVKYKKDYARIGYKLSDKINYNILANK